MYVWPLTSSYMNHMRKNWQDNPACKSLPIWNTVIGNICSPLKLIYLTVHFLTWCCLQIKKKQQKGLKFRVPWKDVVKVMLWTFTRPNLKRMMLAVYHWTVPIATRKLKGKDWRKWEFHMELKKYGN